MRNNKRLVCLTGIIFLISVIALIYGETDMVQDIALSFMGSAFLGCSMSLMTYGSEKEMPWKNFGNLRLK